jgi:hypothetical protein
LALCRRYLGVTALLLLGGALPATAVSEDGSPRPDPNAVNVLLIYTTPRLAPSIVAIDEAFRATLESRLARPVFFYTEYLDLEAADSAEPSLREFLLRKYSGRRLDLILTVSSPALRFALQYRPRLFVGVPIVFAAVDPTAVAGDTLDADVTGTWLKQAWAPTLDAALRLHPGTRRVVVITGSGAPDKVWLAEARTQLAPYQSRLEVVYRTDVSFGAIVEEVGALQAGTILLLGPFTRDAERREFVTAQALKTLGAAASVPAYSFSEAVLGTGIVGGNVVSFRMHGLQSAELAARVLRGERPAPTSAGTTSWVFDGRQLARWSIDERRLPPGSEVHFRTASAWQSYRWYILGGATVIVVQGALIGGLLVSRRQRRHAQAALAERLRFERLLGELSATLAGLATDETDAAIENGLRRIALDLDVDRVMLFDLGRREGDAEATHSWTRGGRGRPMTVELARFPWIAAQLRRNEAVRYARLDDLPEEAAPERAAVAEFGLRSLLVVPFTVAGSLHALACVAVRTERQWPDELVQRFHLLAEVFANVLDRRWATQAMRESEQRFRLLAESAPLMIWMSSADGRRTYFNRRWSEVAGVGLEEALEDEWLSCVDANDRDAVVKTTAAALDERRVFTLDYRVRDADGMTRWIIDHGVPRWAADGSFVGYVGCGVDVTELKLAQEALLESNALRSAIFGSLSGHVAAIDREGTIIAVNESWLRLAEEQGVDPVQVSVGANYFKVCRTVGGMSEMDVWSVRAAVAEVLSGAGSRAHREYVSRRSDGERWFDVTVEAFRRPEGGGAVVSHVDITRRRQAEDEAQRQREELAHTLRVTTLGELSASLAHEINQPLAAIVANAQATIRLLDAGQAATTDVREVLRDVAADGKRASEIIRRLRALFRKEHVPTQLLDLNELAAEALSLVRHDFRRKGIVIDSVYEAGLPAVPADAVQLQQVLLNLLVNASEAIAAAPGHPRVILLRTAKRDGYVEIAITDTGIGVPPARLDGMFERFVSTKPDGLGMGLAISRSIVQAHGGRIWATANADRGLTMHVTLPAALVAPA